MMYAGGSQQILVAFRYDSQVNLDPAQYHSDLKQGGPGASVYEGMNLVIRRKAKENNFKVTQAMLSAPNFLAGVHV